MWSGCLCPSPSPGEGWWCGQLMGGPPDDQDLHKGFSTRGTVWMMGILLYRGSNKGLWYQHQTEHRVHWVVLLLNASKGLVINCIALVKYRSRSNADVTRHIICTGFEVLIKASLWIYFSVRLQYWHFWVSQNSNFNQDGSVIILPLGEIKGVSHTRELTQPQSLIFGKYFGKTRRQGLFS